MKPEAKSAKFGRQLINQLAGLKAQPPILAHKVSLYCKFDYEISYKVYY